MFKLDLQSNDEVKLKLLNPAIMLRLISSLFVFLSLVTLNAEPIRHRLIILAEMGNEPEALKKVVATGQKDYGIDDVGP